MCDGRRSFPQVRAKRAGRKMKMVEEHMWPTVGIVFANGLRYRYQYILFLTESVIRRMTGLFRFDLLCGCIFFDEFSAVRKYI